MVHRPSRSEKLFLETLSRFSLGSLSDAADRRVEEDAAAEVSIAPLREGSLLLEVALHGRKVLLLQLVEVALVSRTEVVLLKNAAVAIPHRVAQMRCLSILGIKRLASARGCRFEPLVE